MVDGPFGHGFDLYKTSDAPEVSSLVDALKGPITRSFKRNRWSSTYEFAVRCVCLNVFAIQFAHPDAYVFFSRSPHVYSRKSVTYACIRRVVDCLTADGLLEADVGKWGGSRNRGRRSRMRATQELRDLFDKHGVRLSMVQTSSRRSLIVLRDEEGNDLPLPEDPDSVALLEPMYANLEEINLGIGRCFIGLHIRDVEVHDLAKRMAGHRGTARYLDFSRKSLHRVFNMGSLDIGGRFFGAWWQNVPSEYRLFIHIANPGSDHQRAVEIDYSSMHPAIAYARVDIELETDPYEVPAVTAAPDESHRRAIRNVSKLALNVALNADSLDSAKKAIISELVKQRDETVVRAKEPYLPQGCPDVDILLEELIDLNEPILQFIGTGAGREFMNTESNIAERVMLRMLHEHNSVVLPVHDSFLVCEDHADALEEFMQTEFRAVTGKACSLKFDETDYDGEWPGDIYHVLTPEIYEEIADRTDPADFTAQTFIRMWEDWQAYA